MQVLQSILSVFTSHTKVALVLGAGPGIGVEVARRWSEEGYAVACVARLLEPVQAIAEEIGNGARGYACDIADTGQLAQCIAQIQSEMGDIECLIYIAGPPLFKPYDELTMDEFNESLAINVVGLLASAKLVCPKMVERGHGVVGITGATASLRGLPESVGFAAAKAAQRSLAQSLARELGPKGVHVFYVVVDSMLDLPATLAHAPFRPVAASKDLAQTFWDLASQPPACWTFEADARPAGEDW